MTVTQKLNKLKYFKTLAFLLCVSIYWHKTHEIYNTHYYSILSFHTIFFSWHDGKYIFPQALFIFCMDTNKTVIIMQERHHCFWLATLQQLCNNGCFCLMGNIEDAKKRILLSHHMQILWIGVIYGEIQLGKGSTYDVTSWLDVKRTLAFGRKWKFISFTFNCLKKRPSYVRPF